MRAEDQAIFGNVFEQIADLLPAGWEMSVGTLASAQPSARFRAMAMNVHGDDLLVLHGSTPLAAAARLLEALRQHLRAG